MLPVETTLALTERERRRLDDEHKQGFADRRPPMPEGSRGPTVPMATRRQVKTLAAIRKAVDGRRPSLRTQEEWGRRTAADLDALIAQGREEEREAERQTGAPKLVTPKQVQYLVALHRKAYGAPPARSQREAWETMRQDQVDRVFDELRAAAPETKFRRALDNERA